MAIENQFTKKPPHKLRGRGVQLTASGLADFGSYTSTSESCHQCYYCDFIFNNISQEIDDHEENTNKLVKQKFSIFCFIQNSIPTTYYWYCNSQIQTIVV